MTNNVSFELSFKKCLLSISLGYIHLAPTPWVRSSVHSLTRVALRQFLRRSILHQTRSDVLMAIDGFIHQCPMISDLHLLQGQSVWNNYIGERNKTITSEYFILKWLFLEFVLPQFYSKHLAVLSSWIWSNRDGHVSTKSIMSSKNKV